MLALVPYATRPYADAKTYISEKFIEAFGENMHRMEDFLGARHKHSQNMKYCAWGLTFSAVLEHQVGDLRNEYQL